MVVAETADDFRATVTALKSLDVNRGVSFYTSLPDDRRMRLLVKNLGTRMPKLVLKEELCSPGYLCPGSFADPQKNRHMSQPFILSAARGPEAAKFCAVTQLCDLRVSVETYTALKGPL